MCELARERSYAGWREGAGSMTSTLYAMMFVHVPEQHVYEGGDNNEHSPVTQWAKCGQH